MLRRITSQSMGIAIAIALGSAMADTHAANADNLPGMAAQPAEYFYTGKPYDADSGFYTFRYRNYDPELNRWTSADPSGFPDGANNQVYAPNPFSEFDWMGLETKVLHAVGTFNGLSPAGSFDLRQTFSVDYNNGVKLVGPVSPTGSHSGTAAAGVIIAGASISSSLVPALTDGTLVSSQMTVDNKTADHPYRTYSYTIHLQTVMNHVISGNVGLSFSWNGGTYTIGSSGSETIGISHGKTISGSVTVLE